jgi:NADH-quinone oxidoreductase subunit L
MFNLIWLIPLFPLLAFALIILVTHDDKKMSTNVAWAGIGLSWLVSWGVFFQALGTHNLAEEPYHVPLFSIPTGTSVLSLGFFVDPLTAVMLFMVPFVCLMIFIYAKGYMGFGTEAVDRRYSRFFAYISLFACGMLGLIISDNLLTLFVFWEIMGLCSYLLIGFWFEKSYADPNRITPKQAGLKAFLTTRVGDVIMLIGLLFLYAQTGSLSFATIFSEATLHQLATSTVALPLLGAAPVATVIAMLIFGGSMGKSAQFPLHVWLPDAMEGPTPVSALIHAATMVSAGVYLIARCFPLFQAVPHGPQLALVSFIGAFTALMASTIALAQNDIKRVLAYSTISQLGYMFAALGIGGYVAAVFHLITHAFFKALLFLGSGSVIHGVEHGHHQLVHHVEADALEYDHCEPEDAPVCEVFDANDMMNMGGLGRKMPRTFIAFLAGTLALAGIAPFAGFWSKDEILAHAWEEFAQQGIVSWPFFVWLLLSLGAFLTAFYMARQIFLVFTGEPRTEAAQHAHESPGTMTWPLLILAVFAVFLGLVGTPWANYFHKLVGEAFPITPFTPIVAGLSTLLALGGLFLGYLVYGRKPLTAGQPDPLQARLGGLYTWLQNKYYVDEFYHTTIIRPALWLASLFYKFDDKWVIDPAVDGTGKLGNWLSQTLRTRVDDPLVDGAVNGVGFLADWSGRGLRLIQTGRVQEYLLFGVTIVLMLLGLYLYL